MTSQMFHTNTLKITPNNWPKVFSTFRTVGLKSIFFKREGEGEEKPQKLGSDFFFFPSFSLSPPNFVWVYRPLFPSPLLTTLPSFPSPSPLPPINTWDSEPSKCQFFYEHSKLLCCLRSRLF